MVVVAAVAQVAAGLPPSAETTDVRVAAAAGLQAGPLPPGGPTPGRQTPSRRLLAPAVVVAVVAVVVAAGAME